MIVDEEEELHCGDRWVGSTYLAAARSNLYFRADGADIQDTVSIVYAGFEHGFRRHPWT